MKSYAAVIERDPETKRFVGYVAGWPGAHCQGETLDELQHDLVEVVATQLADGEPRRTAEFVGLQTVPVA